MTFLRNLGGPKFRSRPLPGRQLLLHGVADGRRRRGLRRLVLFNLFAFLLSDGRAIAQANAPRFRADLDDLEVIFLAGFERTSALQRSGGRAEVRWTLVASAPLFDFRVVAQSFDVVAKLNKRAESRNARHLALDHVAHTVLPK